LLCADLIEQKPYTKWTKKEVSQILNASPWVGLSPGGFRVSEYRWPPRISDPATRDNVEVFHRPFYYRVRLLTAKPVREAWLRKLEIEGIIEPTVAATKLSSSSKEKKAALERYLASHPDDGALTGDIKNIIIGITIRIDIAWATEESSASELSNVSAASQLTAETILSTDTGKQVHLLKYVPPGQDRFGARYYFPRYLASGAPLLGTNDKQLQFETRIDNHPVKVKFDLTKMRYKGQLES
jgi:hypothetical protein